MSGEVTDQQIDLAVELSGSYFRVVTDLGKEIVLYTTAITGSCGIDFARGIAVVGLESIGDHTRTIVTRHITHGAELRVKSDDGLLDHHLGDIVLIVQGNC